MANSSGERITPKVIVRRVLCSRTVFVILLLAMQLAVLLLPFRQLSTYSLLSAVMIIYIINKRTNPEFKLTWIIPIAVLPVFGALFYLFFKVQPGLYLVKRRSRRLARQRLTGSVAPPDGLFRYLSRLGFPAYDDSKVTYYPMGDALLEQMIASLETAQQFIFVQYFIVAEGQIWDRVRDVLERKAAQGVEVRLMMDGLGILGRLPEDICQQMEEKGIACRIFSPIRPIPSVLQNNRLHRKILVVDGKVAFTGGVNLADEYANLSVSHEWKDVGVRVEGGAVASLTSMFLQTWALYERRKNVTVEYEPYITPHPVKGEGFVAPFGDSPFDEVDVGKRVYLDIINKAESEVHIMTPYLVIDSELLEGLKYAAARGVDVEIMMPGKSDSKLLGLAAISYYRELIDAGVRILIYTPGMVHAKTCVADRARAVVGTINMDYRSLFINLECGCYVRDCSAVLDVEKDFRHSRESCSVMTMEDVRGIPLYRRLLSRVMRLFAPML